MTRENVIVAAQMAVSSDVDLMTCDRIEALTAGHGMLSFAIYAVTNILAEELLRGSDINVKYKNARTQQVDFIMKRAIDGAKAAGADGANAALIAAACMYLCGSAAQVGIPAGNRKLGATARMIAGVDRSGFSSVPTPKMNNKLSGFPAVMAIYQAMEEGRLCEIKGENVPPYIASSAIYGHSALGEDNVWPQLAENGARIGTEAMIKAMNGAALRPDPFICALFGAAAILEIIHPDAEVPEELGKYGRTSSAYLVGKSAAMTAGLPEYLHVKLTGEVFETAKLIGDLGLILKDVGGVSVIGMMAFEEVLSIFEEGVAGASGGRKNSPLGHSGGYCMIALKRLLELNGDMETTAKEIARERFQTAFDGETAMLCLSTMARKSRQITEGPVTDVLIKATQPFLAGAIYRRCVRSYEMLEAGKSVKEIAHSFDEQRLKRLEDGVSTYYSKLTGKKVWVRALKLANGARRTTKTPKKYLAFDPLIDMEVAVDDQIFTMENFCHIIAVDAAKGKRPDLEGVISYAAIIASEVMLAGNIVINCIVPAAVAAAMKLDTPEEIAVQAEVGAYISCGIPGGKANAAAVGRMAVDMIEVLEG